MMNKNMIYLFIVLVISDHSVTILLYHQTYIPKPYLSMYINLNGLVVDCPLQGKVFV